MSEIDLQQQMVEAAKERSDIAKALLAIQSTLDKLDPTVARMESVLSSRKPTVNARSAGRPGVDEALEKLQSDIGDVWAQLTKIAQNTAPAPSDKPQVAPKADLTEAMSRGTETPLVIVTMPQIVPAQTDASPTSAPSSVICELESWTATRCLMDCLCDDPSEDTALSTCTFTIKVNTTSDGLGGVLRPRPWPSFVCEAGIVEFDADYMLSSLKVVLYDGKLSLCHFNFDQWVIQISNAEEKVLLDGIDDLSLLGAINTVVAEAFMSKIVQIGNLHWNFRTTSLYELKFCGISGQISQLGSKNWNIISTEEINNDIVHLTFSEKSVSCSLFPLQQDCNSDTKLIMQWDPGVHNNRESVWISLLHLVTIGVRLWPRPHEINVRYGAIQEDKLLELNVALVGLKPWLAWKCFSLEENFSLPNFLTGALCDTSPWNPGDSKIRFWNIMVISQCVTRYEFLTLPWDSGQRAIDLTALIYAQGILANCPKQLLVQNTNNSWSTSYGIPQFEHLQDTTAVLLELCSAWFQWSIFSSYTYLQLNDGCLLESGFGSGITRTLVSTFLVLTLGNDTGYDANKAEFLPAVQVIGWDLISGFHHEKQWDPGSSLLTVPSRSTDMMGSMQDNFHLSLPFCLQCMQQTNAVFETPLCQERHRIKIFWSGVAPSLLMADLLQENLNEKPKYSVPITYCESGYKLLHTSLLWRTSAVCIFLCWSAWFQWKVAWLLYHHYCLNAFLDKIHFVHAYCQVQVCTGHDRLKDYLDFDQVCVNKDYYLDDATVFGLDRFYLDTFLGQVCIDHDYYFYLIGVSLDYSYHRDYDQAKHQVQWDPGDPRWSRLGVKLSFKEGGMSRE